MSDKNNGIEIKEELLEEVNGGFDWFKINDTLKCGYFFENSNYCYIVREDVVIKDMLQEIPVDIYLRNDVLRRANEKRKAHFLLNSCVYNELKNKNNYIPR